MAHPRPGPSVAALLLAAALAAGQEPPPAPVFGTGVDVVAVDVSVLDAHGRPVTGLRPDEFQVTLDGQPRPLLSAEFQHLGSLGDEREAPRPTHYSTNEGVPQGRLVVLAVDQGALPSGAGRNALNAAGRLLDRLTPADRVALLAYPEGPLVDFTADRAKVREALGRVVGRSRLRRGRVSPEEVLALEAGDRGRWADVVARECDLSAGVPRETCLFELENEARRLQAELRRETLDSSQALRGLLRALARLDAPKAVVLITGGLWAETPATVRELAELAGQARASLHVVQLDEPLADAEDSRSLSGEGLGVPRVLGWRALAVAARGDLFRVAGTGDSAFDQLAREISGFYLVGFTPEAGDRDGQPHRLRVSVTRPGLTVRAREQVRLPLPGQPLRPPAATLQALLLAPYQTAGLPLRVASFARPAPGRVDVLVRAELGRAGESLRGVEAGWIVLDGRGQAVARGQRALPDGPGPLDLTVEVALPPGLYTLRLAATDARERRGSLEHALKAAPLEGGGLAFSDLMLVPPGGAVEPPEPGVDVTVGTGALGAALEVMGRGPDLQLAAVRLEIARSEQGPALLSLPLPLHDSGPGRQLGTGTLTLDELEPGDYWARAVVLLDGRAVGQAARPFRRG